MLKYLLIIAFVVLPGLVHAVDISQAFVNLAKKVRSSVVNISTKKEEMSNMVQIFPGYFMPYHTPEMKASGSGFIVGKEGLIITNAHVVNNFDEIQMQFAGDDKYYPAKVLGADPQSDIALLKVSVNRKLVPFKFGDSEKLQVGEWVAAIGNPHGFGHTMTKGIISAVQREIDDLNLFPLLQTDASINPGNSGGPLVNLKGEVVGVNQAIARGAMGISFAIPINNVKEVFKDLKSFGFVRRGFIGVEFLSDGQKGALITNVIAGSPAHGAGLKVKDRIVEFAGKPIEKPKDLPKQVRKVKIGKKVSLKVIRGGKTVKLAVTPRMLEKDSFSSIQKIPQKKKFRLKGQKVSGGLQVFEPADKNFAYFNLPNWAKHPIVFQVKKASPAFQAGLRAGDLLFQINGRSITSVSSTRKAVKKGANQVKALRYHRRYNKFFLVTVSFTL